MPSQRKFYRTTVQLHILTEDDPADLPSLGEYILQQMDLSGGLMWADEEEPVQLSSYEAVQLLWEHGSEPGYFSLTEDGEDAEL